MTAQELIIELQKMPSESKVGFDGGQGWIEASSVNYVDDSHPVQKGWKDTPGTVEICSW